MIVLEGFRQELLLTLECQAKQGHSTYCVIKLARSQQMINAIQNSRA